MLRGGFFIPGGRDTIDRPILAGDDDAEKREEKYNVVCGTLIDSICSLLFPSDRRPSLVDVIVLCIPLFHSLGEKKRNQIVRHEQEKEKKRINPNKQRGKK